MRDERPGRIGVTNTAAPALLQLLEALLHRDPHLRIAAGDLGAERRKHAARLGMQRVIGTQVAAQTLRDMVGRRVLVAGQHFGAVGDFLHDQLGEQGFLAWEVPVEGASRQTDAGHQLIDPRGAEAALFRDGAGAGQELLAGFLLVRDGIAHEAGSPDSC